MHTLESKRDELAWKCSQKYQEIKEQNMDREFMMIEPVFCGFCNGFDASTEFWIEEVRKLKTALEDLDNCIEHSTFYLDGKLTGSATIIQQALAELEKNVGEL